MRRGFKGRGGVLEELQKAYNDIVFRKYGGDFLEALKSFDSIAEDKLRPVLKSYYNKPTSRDQAWRTCKGSLYEYAVFMCLTSIIERDDKLRGKMTAVMGNQALNSYGKQIAIRNWCDIFPDVDILLIDGETNLVRAILSCKTSLRERLTETAFWKRELERNANTRAIKLVFVTTDKDDELKLETNRYILLHVVDCTFITDPRKYRTLIGTYRQKYGNREDFDKLLQRVKPIDKMQEFLHAILQCRNTSA